MEELDLEVLHPLHEVGENIQIMTVRLGLQRACGESGVLAVGMTLVSVPPRRKILWRRRYQSRWHGPPRRSGTGRARGDDSAETAKEGVAPHRVVRKQPG